MSTKQRLSATVDADLLRSAEAAVRAKKAPNLSAWVNLAMRRQLEHEERMRALDAFIDSYEAEHGRITEEDIRGASRRASARAVVIRPPAAPIAPKRRAVRSRGGA